MARWTKTTLLMAGLCLAAAGCSGNSPSEALGDGGVTDGGNPDGGSPDGGTPSGRLPDGGYVLNCAVAPSACGYPDETNTGIPDGTTLTRVPEDATEGDGWSWNSTYQMIEVDGAGATLENLDVTGGIDVNVSQVTIRHCRITLTGEAWGIGLRHSNDVTVDGCEISSPAATGPDRLLVGIKDIYGDTTGSHIVRNEIWHTSTAIQIANGVIENNYVHDFGLNDGDHLNGVTVGGGDDTPLTVRHNTIFNDHDQTDAISLFQDFGGEANKMVDDNLVAGGGYCIYGGAGSEQTSNIRITNNRIATLYAPNGGDFGWLAAWDETGPDNVLSGNIWDDTGDSADADFTTHP
jgi:hypothetical protein